MRATTDSAASQEPHRLSRQEIEIACVLDVAARTGCYRDEFAGELGLSPALSGAIARAVEPLLVLGLVVETDGRLVVTGAGKQWLEERLARAGVGGTNARSGAP